MTERTPTEPPARPARTKPPRPAKRPPTAAPAEVLAGQRRRLLAKHYIAKYRVRRGR